MSGERGGWWARSFAALRKKFFVTQMDRFFKQEEGTIPQLRAVYDNLQTVVQQVNDSDHVDDTSQALHSW